MNDMGYVYLMKSGEYGYKIGFTKKDVFVRLDELNTGNPYRLEIIHALKTEFDYKVESTLHSYFNNKRIRGEWFKLSEDDVKRFPDIFYQIEGNFLTLKLAENNYM